MSSVSYYLLCLAAVLLVSAAASALIVRGLRARELRVLKIVQLLDALTRYSAWVSAQGRAVDAPTQETDSVVQEIGALQQLWFPELRAQVEQLFALHIRLARLLRSQHTLRLRDPEAWLESDYDKGFLALWREHCAVVQVIEQRLAPAMPTAAPSAQMTFS